MEPFGIQVIIIAAVAGYAIYKYLRSDAYLVPRALRSAQRVPIGEFPDGGAGKIVGVVRAEGQTLAAPLSGRACVYYSVRIVQQKGKSYQEVAHEARGVPFLVEDETGRAFVDPESCRISLEVDAKTGSGTWDDATQAEEALLSHFGLASQGMVFNKSYRYEEGVVEPGELVAVLGRGIREIDPAARDRVTGYRDAAPTRVRMVGSPDHPVFLTDKSQVVDQ